VAMRFFHNTNIPFMKYRHHWVVISTVLNLIAIVLMLTKGFTLGVDFAGGTQLTLKFKGEPDLSRVRRALEDLKMGDVSIQRFDEPQLHQILVHLQNPHTEGAAEGVRGPAGKDRVEPTGRRLPARRARRG